MALSTCSSCHRRDYCGNCKHKDDCFWLRVAPPLMMRTGVLPVARLSAHTMMIAANSGQKTD